MTPVVVLLVVSEGAPLLAAPRAGAARQAVLHQGEWLEERGERQGYLQVYHHGRERPGYVRAQGVRRLRLDEEGAREALAVARFLGESAGAEALGIGYVAAHLRAARTVNTEALELLGGFAERLARRSSRRSAGPDEATLTAHVEVAESYGVHFLRFEREGRVQLCYDGEAHRGLLALEPPLEVHARAVLALTREACVDPALLPSRRAELFGRWLTLVERTSLTGLRADLAQRLRLRRADLLAELTWSEMRGGRAPAARARAEAAIGALASVDARELPEEEQGTYQDVAVRVASVRPAVIERRSLAPLALRVTTSSAGESCLELGAPGEEQRLRCTYGVVWIDAARAAPDGKAVAVPVSPLPGWTELLVLRLGPAGWSAEPLVPSSAGPGVGYVELAGWTPDAGRALLVREARGGGAAQQSFELLALDTLSVEKRADHPRALTPFSRHRSAEWAETTLSLRAAPGVGRGEP